MPSESQSRSLVSPPEAVGGFEFLDTWLELRCLALILLFFALDNFARMTAEEVLADKADVCFPGIIR